MPIVRSGPDALRLLEDIRDHRLGIVAPDTPLDMGDTNPKHDLVCDRWDDRSVHLVVLERTPLGDTQQALLGSIRITPSHASRLPCSQLYDLQVAEGDVEVGRTFIHPRARSGYVMLMLVKLCVDQIANFYNARSRIYIDPIVSEKQKVLTGHFIKMGFEFASKKILDVRYGENSQLMCLDFSDSTSLTKWTDRRWRSRV